MDPTPPAVAAADPAPPDAAAAAAAPNVSGAVNTAGRNVRLRVSRYGIPENEPEPHDISALDLAHRLVNTDIESPTIQCIGSRRSGKSYYIRWLLYYMTALGKEYDLVLLFSGTISTGQWPMIPSKFQFEGWNNESAAVLDQVIARQKQTLKHNQEATSEAEKKPLPECLCVFDDVLGGDGNLWVGKKADTLQSLFWLGRHLRIGCILCVQDLKALSKVRKNSDCLIIYRSPSHTQRKDIRDAHCTCKGCSPDDVRCSDRFMEKCWSGGKHSAMCIDLAGSHGRNELQSYVYSTTAPPDDTPEFGMGAEEHWQLE